MLSSDDLQETTELTTTNTLSPDSIVSDKQKKEQQQQHIELSSQKNVYIIGQTMEESGRDVQLTTLQQVESTSHDSNNNTYETSNLNTTNDAKFILDANISPALKVTTSIDQPNKLETYEPVYHPSTTTVNLSESNQSVYFMLQTASPVELITSQPATAQILTPNSNNNSLKLKSSPTATPSSKKVYSPKYLDGSQILGTVVSVNSTLSSSSSSLNTSPNGTTKIVRDERRRANHNEVERRRRDNINKWIVELSKVIPDCSNDQSKHGQSKGGILEKTVQYLIDIKQTNQELHEHIRSLQGIKEENEILRHQNEIYKKENEYYKNKIEVDNSSMLIDPLEEFKSSIDASNNVNNMNQAAATSSSAAASSSAITNRH